jgi:hypothetical protein
VLKTAVVDPYRKSVPGIKIVSRDAPDTNKTYRCRSQTNDWPDHDGITAARYIEAHMRELARTLTGYYIGVLVVLAILNVIAWLVDAPLRYGLGVFSAGFLMGALGMYIAAYLYGYRKS